MYFVYILHSAKDNLLYTGFTVDLDRRMNEHNDRCQLSTQHRTPFQLIYYEWCIDKKDAVAREKYLKSGMGKRYIKNRLKCYFERIDNL
jgi:putative endonuclease